MKSLPENAVVSKPMLLDTIFRLSIEQKRATETDIDRSVGTRYLVFLDASGNEVERL